MINLSTVTIESIDLEYLSFWIKKGDTNPKWGLTNKLNGQNLKMRLKTRFKKIEIKSNIENFGYLISVLYPPKQSLQYSLKN